MTASVGNIPQLIKAIITSHTQFSRKITCNARAATTSNLRFS